MTKLDAPDLQLLIMVVAKEGINIAAERVAADPIYSIDLLEKFQQLLTKLTAMFEETQDE